MINPYQIVYRLAAETVPARERWSSLVTVLACLRACTLHPCTSRKRVLVSCRAVSASPRSLTLALSTFISAARLVNVPIALDTQDLIFATSVCPPGKHTMQLCVDEDGDWIPPSRVEDASPRRPACMCSWLR